ncbi:MAG TPA: RluA family pseudouridine synthase, partial [Polyangia bacterium]|nr:RluA family pseudouridine synthase [Polyangia bacterium]
MPPRLPRSPDLSFAAPAGVTVAAALRGQLPGKTWREVRRLCERGKVTVAGAVELDPARRLDGGEAIEVRADAPTPERPGPEDFRLVFEDGHLVIIEKPQGVTS